MKPPTTPTGIPVRRCSCGYTHPVTRGHCARCGRPSAFLNDQSVCTMHRSEG